MALACEMCTFLQFLLAHHKHFKRTIHLQKFLLHGKGVSDLETFMDYFALPGKSCKNLLDFYEQHVL